MIVFEPQDANEVSLSLVIRISMVIRCFPQKVEAAIAAEDGFIL